MIFNQKVPPAEYSQKVVALRGTYTPEQLFAMVKNKTTFPAISAIGNQSPTMGDHIQNSHDVVLSYDVNNCENCRYSTIIFDAHDRYDYFSWGE